MNDSHANAGFVKCSGTAPLDLSATPVQGFTPLNGDVVFSAMQFPARRAASGYNGDTEALLGDTFLEGVYYPIPLIGCTLASGEFIGWLD